MFVLVLAAYVLLGIYEFVPLYKQKQWKDFFVNLALGIISLCIGLLLSLDVDFISPILPIKNLLKTLWGE
ncbi:hypothetical protein [Acetivibrio clariflavus]|uniref:VanZ like family protein n=1 Tax=Acetivibrio clariflavus (strain DSM 19732 / NBRC 101661 / EBR45) TaxID=720554 RepID=G8LW90_ACECE|nr:hypothetical protein [Acetivibrio clariflavus]AEV69737.1 hypothetical protein Clocl_3221 [Acetivibrio clariflavus DSM 19732]HOQ01378.1 hypothetical protein [Acetivibrio clariflavus]HPU41162.1 hypothetical protein [Acetivibrio clariflavus]